ncbi:MAG: proteinase inhibitor serpin [Pedosphaera sp.]|nr:proteinase inhibitor serpin [Pedosphaera sp.]
MIHKLLLALASAGFLAAAGRASGALEGQTNGVVAGNTAFACELYGQLKGGEGNLFFSPYSISTCLAMTYAGARGETEKEMARVMHWGTNRNEVQAGFGELQKQLNEAQNKVELNVANALWAQKGHPFLPDFLKVAQEHYAANVKQIDFGREAIPASREINAWVEEKTKGKIRELVEPGMFNEYTRLVLADAIYFKGSWEQPFPPKATSTQPFHISKKRKVDAPLMTQTERFGYFETESIQVVELPYLGHDLAMTVFLPKWADHFSDFEKALKPENLPFWLGRLKEEKVEVWLPRFKMESSYELKTNLMAMGMAEAFGQAADFSGMDGAKDLFISSIRHKAFVETDEKGTEAAAATGMMLESKSIEMDRPPVFRADHPFIFLIRDRRSGSILFLGRVVNPSK